MQQALLIKLKSQASFSLFTVHLKAVYRGFAFAVQNASPHLPEFCYLLIFHAVKRPQSIGLNGVWTQRLTEPSSIIEFPE